ncbi:hypothetical protein OF83DRAFT_1086544, partial [Amylostereum chailletii]
AWDETLQSDVEESEVGASKGGEEDTDDEEDDLDSRELGDFGDEDEDIYSWDFGDDAGDLLNADAPDAIVTELPEILPNEQDWIIRHVDEFRHVNFSFHQIFCIVFEKEILQQHDELVAAISDSDQEKCANLQLKGQKLRRSNPSIMLVVCWTDHLKADNIIYEAHIKAWTMYGVPLLTFEAIPTLLAGSFKLGKLTQAELQLTSRQSGFKANPKDPTVNVTQLGNLKKPWPKMTFKDGLPQLPQTVWTSEKLSLAVPTIAGLVENVGHIFNIAQLLLCRCIRTNRNTSACQVIYKLANLLAIHT